MILNTLLNIFNNLIVFTITLLIGFIIGRLSGETFKLTFKEINDFNLLPIRRKFSYYLSNFIEYFIYFITVLIALNNLNLLIYVVYFIFLILFLIMLGSFILFLIDFFPNLFARSKVKNIFIVGDKITIMNITGTIQHLGFFETVINENNNLIYVPNRTMLDAKKRY